MKNINIIALFACVFALCLALAGCGDSGDSSQESGDQAGSATTTESIAAEESTGETTISAADLANVDIAVEYGDFEAMSALAADIQGGRVDGSVVQIDGNVVSYGTSASIVEPNEDNSKRIGTVFQIEGAAESDYPADGQHVKITGVVGADDTGYTHFIKTLPDFVEVLG